MASQSGDVVATTVLVVEASAGLYAAFCPSWFTVRSPFFSEQRAHKGNVRSIRQGEIAATILTVGTGLATSYMVHSILPAIGASVMSAVMVAGYEYSMRHPATGEGGQRAQGPTSLTNRRPK